MQNNVLSYHTGHENTHFVEGTIDLRTAIAAEVTPSTKGKSKDNDETDFTITTPKRVYLLRAHSEGDAEAWVNKIRKVIFRLQNDESDHVEVLIPITNVMDIGQVPIMANVETIRVRAVDNHDTYALDEVIKSVLSLVTWCKANCCSTSSLSSTSALMH